MLPRVHKHIDGGHQWLSWALGRERALRASGILWAEHKYAMPDGTLVRVQIAGDDSHVWLTPFTGDDSGVGWIAYPCKIAPAVFESAAHATTPVENRPVVEKIPFVAIPRVPYPTPPNLTFPEWPVDPPSGVGPVWSTSWFPFSSGLGYNGQWTMWVAGGPIRDEFGNIIGYEPGQDVPVVPQPEEWSEPSRTWFLGSAKARLIKLGIQMSLPGIQISFIQVQADDPRIQATENALYEYSVAVHTYNIEAAAANAAYAAAKAAVDAQNASVDKQNNENFNAWLGENDAPMIAKKNDECDAWDAPKRPIRKAFMDTLFTRVLAEVEAGLTTKWLTKVVLSPSYLPIGPFEPAYFIRRISSSSSTNELESRTTETVTYSVSGPGGTERTVVGVKTETSSFGPAGDCFTLNGARYSSPFTIYTFSNYWLGDPANDMRDIFPSSTSRGRGYLATGTTTQRTGNKFLFSELNEVGLAEAVAFDSSPRLPCATGGLFLDMGFANGCQVSIIVLRYMMWDEGANARVPVVGYTDTTSSFVCQSGNCLESNFVSRTPAPRNAADGVWLESVVTMTKANSQWSAPTVTKYPGVFLCPIVVDNTPRENVYEQVTLGIPFAQFPDFVVVVRGMRQPYAPKTDALATAFTDKFFRLDTTELSVPPAIDCTTVAQMRDRITLEAIKRSNL